MDAASESLKAQSLAHSQSESLAPSALKFDIYKPDRRAIDTQKVLFVLWKVRFNGAVFYDVMELIVQFLGEKRVLNEMEYYLPQFAQIMIHFCGADQVLVSRAMQLFLISICQISIPVAFQLYFMLISAVEDYQPRLVSGLLNPSHNRVKHAHCCHLLNLVMQTIVFGNPILSSVEEKRLMDHMPGSALQDLYDQEREQRATELLQDSLTKSMLDIASNDGTRNNLVNCHAIASPSFPALPSLSLASSSLSPIFSSFPMEVLACQCYGILYTKPLTRKTIFSFKRWKPRFYCISNRVLYCFHIDLLAAMSSIIVGNTSNGNAGNNNVDNTPYGNASGSNKVFLPLYAVYLPMANIAGSIEATSGISNGNKYNYNIEITHDIAKSKVLLRARDQQEHDEWLCYLTWEANRPPSCSLLAPSNDIVEQSSGISLKKLLDQQSSVGLMAWNLMLTAGQLKRFRYFEQHIRFTFALTDICERLRTVPEENRHGLLQQMLSRVEIPPFYSLPTTTCLSSMSSVLSIPASEAKIFKTKASCPCLISFEAENHPTRADFTSFVSAELQEYEESDVVALPSVLHSFSSLALLSAVSTLTLANQTAIKSPGSAADLALSSTSSSVAVRKLSVTTTSFSYPVLDGVTMHRVGWKPDGAGMLRVAQVTGRPALQLQASARAPLNRSSSVRNSDTTADPPTAAAGASTSLSVSVPGPMDSQRMTSAPSPLRTPSGLAASTSMRNSISITRESSGGSGDGAVVGAMEQPMLPGMETNSARIARLKNLSQFGQMTGWKVDAVIAKSNNDLRQEAFIMQIIQYLQLSFQRANVPVWLKIFKIVPCSKAGGLIQFIPNALPLDTLKKNPRYGTLRNYFESTFGPANSDRFNAAVSEFVKSLAGYFVVCYMLAIKDRHNGNIMLDDQGHIIHIDYGYVLGLAPGNQFSVESAPFKLTTEYMDLMGGPTSSAFKEFKALCHAAFLVARKHSTIIIGLLDIMATDSLMPAFVGNPHAVSDFRARLYSEVPDDKLGAIIDTLIKQSLGSFGTGIYDRYQNTFNGYAM